MGLLEIRPLLLSAIAHNRAFSSRQFRGVRRRDRQAAVASGLGRNTRNGPQTFLLDGRQFVFVGAGDALYAFALQ
jgi:hypothetical protein